MNINKLLNPELIIHLSSLDKKGVINELITLISEVKSVTSSKQELISEKIFYREELMSTGIGRHLGIPHCRVDGMASPVIAIGIQKNGVKDYEAMDSLPVKVVIMILCGIGQHRLHIKILSQIVAILKKNNNINRVIDAQDSNEICQIFMESQ
ncbi:MAG: PTS sugar transporter subunit IIA [Chitinispirillia bacterium]|jgi:mannitol/fructose-specific phosphotransferase system IIA component (Ntr-type)